MLVYLYGASKHINQLLIKISRREYLNRSWLALHDALEVIAHPSFVRTSIIG